MLGIESEKTVADNKTPAIDAEKVRICTCK